MCLASGAARTPEVSGAAYVQNSISTVFGSIGPIFITIAMVLFAFTTLIGNLFYVVNALTYLNHKKKPSKRFMLFFHIICVGVVFIGAIVPMGAAWSMADIAMAGMTLINLPACMLLGKVAIDTLKDYEKQKKQGLKPVFKAKDIGLNEDELDFWK